MSSLAGRRLPRTRTAGGLARPELLASTDWLAEQIGRPDVRVLDVRWRPDGSAQGVWAAGHIPGAVHMDWRADLTDPSESGDTLLLAGPEQVARTLSVAGVGDGSTVVVYDDTVSLFASRTWWSLRVYGLDSVRILDGGYPAWIEEGRAVSNAVGPPPPARFTPRAQPRMRLTTSDVRALLSSPDVTLLDARAPAEYRGHEGNTKRLGHIPGAVNVPVGAMTQPGSQHFRAGHELRELLFKANVARGRRMVCYDGSGIAAAKLAYALTLLGHDDVAVYDGGWSEWGNRLDLPVDR
ncbi:MAG TPA: sulfurtransferase [Candidatus Limnocylindrales bacterium]|nr:sulfurtransferase [Candidatus Limnocylindrales bacterium]